MATTRYGARRAVNELNAIFACQWSNGMLPQIRFVPGQTGYRPDADDWGVDDRISGPTPLRTSGITQPPVLGIAALEVYDKLNTWERSAYRTDFLAIVSGIERYHQWLIHERDPWRENLLLCLHPWETGTDNSPAFDPLIESTRLYVEAHGLPVDTFGRADTAYVSRDQRPTDRDYYAYFGLLALFKSLRYDQASIIAASPFLLQDVLFNTVFVASLRSLADLQRQLAETFPPEEATALRRKARESDLLEDAVANAIRSKLWHPRRKCFLSYDCRGRALLPTLTVAGLLPLMDGIADEAQAYDTLALLTDPGLFWTGSPLPSTPPGSASFNPLRYWSGPSWPVTNWLVLRGLRDHSPEFARALVSSSLGMIEEGVGPDIARRAGGETLERNSVNDEFTTPSTRQYRHAWLWDSAIVAISWPLVEARPSAAHDREMRGQPGFWEYYHPTTGAPLGAPRMTWTASLYLELDALSRAMG